MTTLTLSLQEIPVFRALLGAIIKKIARTDGLFDVTFCGEVL